MSEDQTTIAVAKKKTVAKKKATPAKSASVKKASTKKSPAVKKPSAKKAAAKATQPKVTAKKTAPAKKTAAVKKAPTKPTIKKASSKKTEAGVAANDPSPQASQRASVAQPSATNEEPAENTSANTAHEHAQSPNGSNASEAVFDKDKMIKELKEKDWGTVVLRGVFMLIFGILCQLALYVVFVLALVQFLIMIGTGKPNSSVTSSIATAARYMSQTMNYLSFKTELKPFPFDRDFPSED